MLRTHIKGVPGSSEFLVERVTYFPSRRSSRSDRKFNYRTNSAAERGKEISSVKGSRGTFRSWYARAGHAKKSSVN